MKGTRDLNAEFDMIKDVCDVETLCCRIPWMKGFFEETEAVRKALYDQAQKAEFGRGQFTRMSGFAQGDAWRHSARVPQSIVFAVEQLCPGFWADDKKCDRFFKENPQFVVAQRVH